MNKKLVYKKFIMLLMSFFVLSCFSDILYATQDLNKDKPLKIFWQNKDITQKLYPAIGKGKIYIIDKNFISEVRGYSLQAPLFKKNDRGEWSQLALNYVIDTPKPILHEKITDIRVYTDSTLISIADLSGISNHNMKLPTEKCKKKKGKIHFVSEERKLVSEGSGYTYEPDDIVQIKSGEYFLHYVSLEDLCSIFNLKLIFDEQNNIYKISN
ncbi:MAG: hypothetical protein STSR0004_09790 [Peptococcaceae bacterium]